MAGQRDIWKTLQDIFKIFHSKAILQWCKLCLATYLIKPRLAILEALFLWLYYWLVLGNKSDCCKEIFHLMQLTWNYGEPHIYLHQVFQRFWLGNLLTTSHICNCIIQQCWSQWFQGDASIDSGWFVFSNVTIVNIGGRIFALFCYEGHLKINLRVINAVFLRHNP